MITDDDSIADCPERADTVRRNYYSTKGIYSVQEFGDNVQNDRMTDRRKRPLPQGRPVGCPFVPIPGMQRDFSNFSTCTRGSPDRFYESHSGSPYISHLLTFPSMDDGFRRRNILLSQKLPGWMWFLLARSLGIKLSLTEKPIFATFLHVLTAGSALTFGMSGFWFKIYDIKSEFSRTTVLIGSVSILIGFTWVVFGIYAHRLAGRLFSNKNFAESVRMHSKTFMKISIALIVMILSFVVIAVNLYGTVILFSDKSCTNIQLLPVVCKIMYISRAVYAFFCIIWNLLVVFILLSVCRTHTVGIRRFMRELAVDAHVFERLWMENVLCTETKSEETISTTNDIEPYTEWYVWDDSISVDEENVHVTSQNIFLESITGNINLQTPSKVLSPQKLADRKTERSADERDLTEVKYPETQQPNQSVEMTDNVAQETDDNAWKEPFFLTNDDLLFSYWKIYSRLSITCRYLQRWLFSWIMFILIWCADYIIYWTSHDATLTGILEFIIPLLLLLIISSAYAEVNAEGQRLLKCICPMEERLSVLFFLNQQPLQMQVYGFTISYNAITTVILAFSVAFASRIILDEVLR